MQLVGFALPDKNNREPAAALFQTAWFVESICTQTLVIFVIWTRDVPFYHSRPSRLRVASTILNVSVACILPFTIIGGIFGFIPLPASLFVVLAILVIGYLAVVELVERWFYTRYGSTIDRK